MTAIKYKNLIFLGIAIIMFSSILGFTDRSNNVLYSLILLVGAWILHRGYELLVDKSPGNIGTKTRGGTVGSFAILSLVVRALDLTEQINLITDFNCLERFQETMIFYFIYYIFY